MTMSTSEATRLSQLLAHLYDNAMGLRSAFFRGYSPAQLHEALDAIEATVCAIREIVPRPPKATP